MRFLLDAIAAVPPLTLTKYAFSGAVIGALLTPVIMFVGLKLNLKGVRKIFEASRIPQTPRLYRLFALGGAAIFAIISASQPVLDAAGKDEVWVRAALIPLLVLAGWPFARALRRLRNGNT